MAFTFVRHRLNQARSLSDLPPAWGAEIDLRSSVQAPQRLHLAHDPWLPGEDFRDWLAVYRERNVRGPLILNTKEDGLESQIQACLKEFGIENYFFLDTALPTLVKRIRDGEGATQAVRFSKYEPLEGCAMVGKAKWAWVDCFEGEPLSETLVAEIAHHFQVCLVSPELQGQPLEKIADFNELVPFASAICTKSPSSWLNLFPRLTEKATI